MQKTNCIHRKYSFTYHPNMNMLQKRSNNSQYNSFTNHSCAKYELD